MRLFSIVLAAGLLAAYPGPSTVPPERVRSGVVKLLREGVPKHGIGARPAHPLLASDVDLEVFARAVSEAAEAKDVPAFLLVAIAFREGSLVSGGVGELGEETMFQLAPGTLKLMEKTEPRCDRATVVGSAYCAATCLAAEFGRCRTWEGAVARYATGRTCWPSSDRAKWVVKDRLGLVRWLDKISRQ
jgi:hypothetical protein